MTLPDTTTSAARSAAAVQDLLNTIEDPHTSSSLSRLSCPRSSLFPLHTRLYNMSQMRLRIDGRTFRDPQNREVTLHGINCAADAKLPATPNLPSHVSEKFFDGDNVSFVNRPFSLEDASTHFSRLRGWGYNTIRYIFTWEAIEHAGPGKYDEEWIDHTISLLRKAKEYGFYIFMDPHQDVVSMLNAPQLTWLTVDSGRGSLEVQERPCGHSMLVVSIRNISPSPKHRSFKILIRNQINSQR